MRLEIVPAADLPETKMVFTPLSATVTTWVKPPAGSMYSVCATAVVDFFVRSRVSV